MKEIELVGKRKEREKHFLKKNGIIVANVYDEDIHFKKDGKYEEIDNTLVDMGNYYTNKNNAYSVTFAKTSKEELTNINIDGNYIKTILVNCNETTLKEKNTESKLHKIVNYTNILDNIDLEYIVMPTKVKESIILKNKEIDIEKLIFIIETNMNLELSAKKIVAKSNGKIYFEFDAPYMVDSNLKTNKDVNYELSKLEVGKYLLKLNGYEKWLNNENIKYPVVIDPTITNYNQNNNVYDAYITSGNESDDNNGDYDGMFVGVSPVPGNDNISRGLLKFDLPTIGTGSQIIDANLSLIGYAIEGYAYNIQLINIHRITAPWDEMNATWNTMHDKYDSKIENTFYSNRSYVDKDGNITPAVCGASITNLVRKWYTGTPNYGIMLKANEEIKLDNSMTMFYTKENNIDGYNPKPILSVSYRNQNGIEDYMDYQEQNFSIGNSYVNNYNGNLTTIFEVGKTISGKMPVELKLIYNTNDVVLNNNYGYGLGYKLNLYQTIKEQAIDGKNYLEYMDSDGTLHYFLNEKTTFGDTGYNTTNTENVYYDEDGLDMTITKNTSDYVLKDKNGNTMKFIKKGSIGYLSEIEDVSGNKNRITYNENNKIIKITDANNAEINISYGDNIITVVSPDETVTLTYLNNKLQSITSLLGTTYFEYNEKNIISKITDINGLQKQYEYYEQSPYKVKKVSEHGIEGTLGEYFNVLYGFDSTTITDSKGNAKNIIFNSQGSIISISGLKSKDDINNAYGISQINGTNDGTNPGYNNKLMRSEIPLKYVKNLLLNTSFENNNIKFTTTDDVDVSISNEASATGLNSLKAVSINSNQELTQNINVEKDNYYTFSGYIKNTGNVRLMLRYLDLNGEIIESQSEIIKPCEEFERYDVTIKYPNNATSDLTLKIKLENPGTTYIDDVQLEEGEVANNYNMLENSDFSNGYSDWILKAWNPNTGEDLSTNDKFELVSLDNGIKAVKAKKNPAYYLSMEKTFKISGKAGDAFNLSFWYKNEGILSNLSMDYGSRTYVSFNYKNIDEIVDGKCDLTSPELNVNDTSWQYVSNDFVAKKDYESITVGFYHVDDANDVYITNMSLFKDIRSVNYEYDEFGNVITSDNLDNKKTNFNYDKNNQLTKMMDPKGKSFMFEYDNNITDRVINGISDMGISNQTKYDSNNNPVLTKILKNNIRGDITDGLYKIRLKGTDKYVRNISNEIKIKDECCSHDLWKLEKVDNYFKISHPIISNRYFTNQSNQLLLANYNDDNSLFELKKNKNGSYLIKFKTEDKYLKYNDSNIEIATLIEDDYHFEFYFETTDSNLFIENKAEYTLDGRFIKSTTDSLGNVTLYDADEVTGLTKSETDPKGNVTNYTYDDKKRLVKTSSGDKKTEYTYNDKNLLDTVKHGTKEYKFNYDEFLNVKTIKIGDNITLVTNHYDTSGDLISFDYGNGASINYEYDNFYRLKKMAKENDTYNYKYDSNGNLVKVLSNNDVTKYTYDLSKRLSEYKFNDFKVKYKYDANDNVINTKYNLDSINNEIVSIVNDDDLITKTSFEDKNIDYAYDALGRLKNRKINDLYDNSYEYLSNGKNTSTLVKNLKLGSDKYSYKYDKLGNITHVYNNDKLINKYYYDDYNQLVKEKDYEENKLIEYKYDNVGNILFRRTYDLKDYSFINQDVYKYNNDEWEDQLTYFNNDLITYDEIGNPLTIGNNINLNWVNGRELESYNDGINSITYKYNVDAIRLSKTVNGIETKYYLEDNDVVYEKTGDNVLYFMRDGIDDLFGFKYNNDTYYYVKNIQNDIIGILDSNCTLVANYKYDSWGKIVSITDGEGNDISNNSSHIANINPFRYRCYYYDKETKLYYLNERYYNPEWRRFINSDSYGGQIGGNILSHNIYAYTLNNPIMNYDENGSFAATLLSTAATLYSIGKAIVLATITLVKGVAAIGAGMAIGSAISNLSKSKSKARSDAKSKSKTSIRQLAEAPSRPCAPASSTFGTVVPIGEPFTIEEARRYVIEKNGMSRDVVCINRYSAEAVASGVNPSEYYLDKAHHGGAPGYFPHFHDIKDRNHAHIWYYIIP